MLRRRARLIRAGHDGAVVNKAVTMTGAAEVNETVTVTEAAEENEIGATKSEYALEHALHPSPSVR